MASLEDLFHGAQLALHVPDQPIVLSDALVSAGDELLDQLQRASQRDQAFFGEHAHVLILVAYTAWLTDERLCSFLTLTLPTLDANAASPPAVLLQFLSHLAVTLDASYVGRTHAPEVKEKPQTRLTLPPHVTGNARHKPPAPLKDSHPSIFPPATPNPVPFTDDGDRGYSQADAGVPLYSYAWGDGPADDNVAFALLRCQRHNAWVALYRLDVSVGGLLNCTYHPVCSSFYVPSVRSQHHARRSAVLDGLNYSARPTPGAFTATQTTLRFDFVAWRQDRRERFFGRTGCRPEQRRRRSSHGRV